MKAGIYEASFRRITLAASVLGLAVALTLSAVPASAATFEVDGVHSSAVFKIKHFGISTFYGMFGDISGAIEYDAENPDGMAVEISIAADSADTRNERRDTHVMSPDFLNAAEFPTISFKSTGVADNGDGTYSVTGDLTLHGVTKEVQVTAEKIGEGPHPRSGQQMIGFESRFTIDRTDYDMDFMAGPLSEEIEFILSLEAGVPGEE
jgi:polyisoprenoid-binding protein YceI